MTQSPPELPARYEFTGTVFSGGQGDVFLYRDLFLDRAVAVKVLKNVADVGGLRAELRALSSVRSKHVVQPFDLVAHGDGQVALLLEFVPGVDLSGYVPSGVDAYLKTLFQIACAVADINGAGLIHRDVKPRNMKFDAEGLIKLFDFGLTSWIDDAETTVHRGTEYYRAPELYVPGPVTLTPAADVYGFGVTAWQLSTGSLPWQLRAMPTTSLPDSFGTHVLGIPDRVVSVLDASLSLDPVARPTSATIRNTLQSQLLYGRHVGRAIWGLKVGELRLANRTLRINAQPVGEATLQYDGFEFSVSSCTGDVFINGIPTTVGAILPESCVVTIGAEALGSGRTHVTFDVSHPEVIV